MENRKGKIVFLERKGKRVLKIKLSSYTYEIKNRQVADKKRIST